MNVVEASSWVTNENTDPVQSPDQTLPVTKSPRCADELVVLGGLHPLCAGIQPSDQSSHIEDLEIGNDTEQQSTQTTESILQKIEQDTEQQIQQKAPICAETCITIMKHGADVFKQQTGRNMTYSEMRNAFG